MVSHTEKGRRFQQKCREALERILGRGFDAEVSIPLPGMKSHAYDLATPERDVVAECKAFGWTKSGNTPSAKITTLREAVHYLRELPQATTLYLIAKKSTHPRRKETLAEYFVRLNKDRLGQVNVLEMPEEGGDLVCLYGDLRGSGSGPALPPRVSTGKSMAVSVEQLGKLRRDLFRLLDWREGRRNRDDGPAKRVSQLRSTGRLPRNIANLMHTVLGFRDAAEYDDYVPTETEASAIWNAWHAILEWAESEGWQRSGSMF